jgi:preprotein translocase subunit YajC
MFISPAYAQGAGGGAGTFEALLPLILIFAVFYFLLIRPQQKKMKQHKEMLGMMRRGDRVVTGGGIIGTITKVLNDNEVTVEIADGVKVKVQRSLISAVLAKTEPGAQEAAPAAPAGGEGLGGIFKGFLGGGRK